MYGPSVASDLVRQIETVVREQNARRAVMIKVRLGASSRISSDDLRQGFAAASQGTPAEGARIDIDVLDDWTDPRALEVALERVELER